MIELLIAVALALPAQEPAKPAETPAPAATTAPPLTDFPLEVYYRDGLRFKTKDGNFEARIGGRLLTHYRLIVDRPDDSTLADGLRTVPDSFFVRQARLEVEGTVLKEFAFKVQTDFPSGTYNQSTGAGPSSTSGSLRDAFVEWRKYPEFKIRMGQFYVPLSQEDFCSTRFIDFAERSNINRLMPGREIGIQFAGTLFEKHLEYNAMLTNGQSLLVENGRNVTDSNDEKEVVGLVKVQPFVGTELAALQKLKLALGGSITDVDSTAGTGFDLVSTELSVMWLDATGGAFDGIRWRLVPQISWSWGPAALRAEYLIREDGLASGSAEEEIRSRGWFGQATYILTGETKTLEDRIVPVSSWGALEVGLRYSTLKILDIFDSGIAASAGNADRISAWTLGLNWWVTRNVRFSANGIYEIYSDPLAFDNRSDNTLVGFLFRAQVDF